MQLKQTLEIDFYLLHEPEDIILLAEKLSSLTLVAFDSETYPLVELYGGRASGLDPHTGRQRLWQFNWEGNRTPYLVDLLKVGLDNLSPLIEQLKREDLIKLAFNMSFDRKMTRGTAGFWLPNTKCCRVVMQRIGICTGFKSSQMRKNSYLAMCRDYFGVIIDKVEQLSDWSLPELSLDQLIYAALDVGAPKSSGHDSLLIQGYLMLKEALEAEPPLGYGVAFPLEVDQQANELLAEIEYAGMPINQELLESLMVTARAELEICKEKLCRDLAIPVEQQLVFIGGVPDIQVVIPDKVSRMLNNPASLTKLINERLAETIGEPLTDVQSGTLEAVLKALQQEVETLDDQGDDFNFLSEFNFGIELVDNVLRYKTLLKLTGTNYLALVNPVTGCLHSSFNILGASTGRMSSGGGQGSFNAQQLSKVPIKIEALEVPFSSQSVAVQMEEGVQN